LTNSANPRAPKTVALINNTLLFLSLPRNCRLLIARKPCNDLNHKLHQQFLIACGVVGSKRNRSNLYASWKADSVGATLLDSYPVD
jgi:hypothetical protein